MHRLMSPERRHSASFKLRSDISWWIWFYSWPDLFVAVCATCLTRWKINGINLGQSGGLPNIEITETKRSFQNCTQFTENNVNGYNSDEPIRNCCFCFKNAQRLVLLAREQYIPYLWLSLRDKSYCFKEVMDCDSDIPMGHQCYNLKVNSLSRHPVETLLFLHATQLRHYYCTPPSYETLCNA